MIRPELSEWFIRIAFVIVSVIHVLPVIGVIGRKVLEPAYGIDLGPQQDLVILMQHRALMFGLLSMACVGAVLNTAWRWPVGVAAMISMLSFVVIAAFQPHGAPIAKVLYVDLTATALLAAALFMHASKAR